MIESQYARALTILTENKDKLTTLAEKLLSSEVIFKEDLVEIFGKRQWEKEEEPLLAEVVEEQMPEISEEETETNEEQNSEENTADAESTDEDSKEQSGPSEEDEPKTENPQ